jgi:hypothetical protein
MDIFASAHCLRAKITAFQSMDMSPPSSETGKGRPYFGGLFQNSYIVFIMETDPFSETLLAF